MDKIKLLAAEFLLDNCDNCDAIAIGILNFKDHTFDSFELLDGDISPNNGGIYFDLASLTKPLTNSFVHIANSINDEKLNLLLNHQAGLPAWGLLSRSNWKEQILSYPILESNALYSDFSAIRYMLEVEKKLERSYKNLVFENLSDQIYFWKDLTEDKLTLQNGYHRQKPNFRGVHDPNAYNIGSFMPHAGLFGTIEGVCKSLLYFARDYSLLDIMQNISRKKNEARFFLGFDTVSDPINTLAGSGCSEFTFGHLGFTGTSFWIDPVKKIGHVILTNATKNYWYQKTLLNQYRKDIGKAVWENFQN